MRILVVEDETKLAAFLKKGLGQEGFAVDVAATAQEALRRAVDRVYDLILLDVGLPDRDGFSVLKTLRQEQDRTPVLMLTAKDSVEDKVRGLETGANDYLAKPFAFKELVARIQVLTRPADQPGGVLTALDMTLDRLSRRVARSGKAIRLTNKELALLEILMINAGRPVSRARLWEHAWEGSLEMDSNVLDVHIGRLRRKIDAGRKIALIQTVHGVGYKIERQAAGA